MKEEKKLLTSKVAVIVGASRGIGRAIAEAFSRVGAATIITAHRQLDRAQSLAASLQKEGFKADAVQLDCSNRNEIQKLFSDVYRDYGSIDILVHNAGIFEQKPFDQLTDEEWDKMFQVNMKGPFVTSQEVLPYMKKKEGGKIIFISSGAGHFGSSRAAHYASSKGALNTFTKSLAKLAAPHCIYVNTIAPGYVETDMIEDLLRQKRKSLIEQIPLKRIGKPEDIAEVALFLAGASSYMTGQVICVDGGASLG